MIRYPWGSCPRLTAGWIISGWRDELFQRETESQERKPGKLDAAGKLLFEIIRVGFCGVTLGCSIIMNGMLHTAYCIIYGHIY